MKPLSLNVHINYTDLDRLIDVVGKLNPKALLVHLDQRSQLDKFWRLYQRHPQIQYVLRMFHPRDAELHLINADPGALLGGLPAKSNIWIQVSNEPSGYENLGPLVDWNIRLIDHASVSGHRLCLVNFATGHPKRNADETEWTSALDPLLARVASARQRVIMGLHEYLPGDGHRVGRYKAMLRRYAKLGLTPPAVVITEFGVDAAFDGDPLNGWKTRGWTEEVYWREMERAYRTHYKLAFEQGQLLGLCVFCYGNSGGWENFDISGSDALLSRMASISVERPVEMDRVRIMSTSALGTNVRSQPNTSGIPLRLIPNRWVEVELGPHIDGTEWRQIRYDGISGYIHGRFITVSSADSRLVLSFETDAERDKFKQAIGALSAVKFTVQGE